VTSRCGSYHSSSSHTRAGPIGNLPGLASSVRRILEGRAHLHPSLKPRRCCLSRLIRASIAASLAASSAASSFATSHFLKRFAEKGSPGSDLAEFAFPLFGKPSNCGPRRLSPSPRRHHRILTWVGCQIRKLPRHQFSHRLLSGAWRTSEQRNHRLGFSQVSEQHQRLKKLNTEQHQVPL
jgi:hypothetical protein